MTPNMAPMHNRRKRFAMVNVVLTLVDAKELYHMRGASQDKQVWSNTVHTCRHLALS
jgi:hypothetical protein